MRQIRNMNTAWVFLKGDDPAAIKVDYDDSHFERINLPHTWNAFDGANGFDYFKGACWYRKTFYLNQEDADKRIFIEFNGSNSVTDVYVNEMYMGQHRGGYSTFRFDITDAVKIGQKNILSVKVDNTVIDDVYPQMADFTFFGGIYRDVNLILTHDLHVDLMDYGSKGIYIQQEDVTQDVALLTVKALVVNEKDINDAVRVWMEVLDDQGNTVAYGAEELQLPAASKETVNVPIRIEHPNLWQGKSNPYLYQLKFSLISFNDTVDSLMIPFGVRYFEVDAEKGFLLNGKHLRLRGVSRHQDRKDMGWAITEKEQDEDMQLIKEVGATSIRLAHYQHNQYFYDLCDKEGMVVWAEIPFISVMSKTELEGINAKKQMKELIRQNFNHPSIFFWGIQNEIQISGERPEVRHMVQELHDLTKKEDPTRLSTMANVMFTSNTDRYNYITDIVGYNKYYGWYQGKVEDFAVWLDEYHKQNPRVKVGISEYGAEGILKYHSDTPQVKDYTEEYHALYHEKVWKIFEQRPFLWGTYVWNMFDFAANIRDEGGVKGRNNKGLVTYDRKIKKDAFYMYKAHWSDEKFVHIASKRFIERAAEKIDVKVYTNFENISLYINDEYVSTLSGTNRIVVFKDVPLTMGHNTIKVKADNEEDSVCSMDIAHFTRVQESNSIYEAPEEKGGVIGNWFEIPDVGDIDVQKLDISDDVYSTKSTIEALYKNDQAREVLCKYLGDLENSPMFSMAGAFSIDTLAELAPEKFDDKLMYVLNRDLSKIKK